jgi:hypothetical protein
LSDLGTGWPQTMQYPVQVFRRYWSSARTCGIVGTRAVVSPRAAPAELLADQEPVGHRRHRHMMMPAQPAASLEMVESELVLELRVILLDPPAPLRPADQLDQRQAPRAGDEPVLRRLRGLCRPLNEEPLLARRGLAFVIAMGRPHPQSRKARREFACTALAPRHGMVRGGRQRSSDRRYAAGPAPAVVPARRRPSAPSLRPAATARPMRPDGRFPSRRRRRRPAAVRATRPEMPRSYRSQRRQ